MARATLVDLSPDVYNQGCHYYPSMVILNICYGGFNGGFNRSIMYVRNKTENVNLNAFNITARINELKTLTQHKSSKFKYKLDGIKCNSNQRWSNCKCQRESKNPIKHHMWERLYLK